MVKKAEMEKLVTQVEEMGARLTNMEESHAEQQQMKEVMDQILLRLQNFLTPD